jgi:ornithine cyclodeaminase/alanine dehydrogenase-like protein (mu-crystallin family)
MACVRVLFVSHSEVPRLLPMSECMEAMAEVLAGLARGEALLPLRQVFLFPSGRGGFASMPAMLSAAGAVGIKAITVVPGNHGTGLDSHQGAVLLFEAEHGQLLAVMDASSITALRTAAVSGVATRALANSDAGDLAILGSGTQAVSHLEAMAGARPLRRVRAWSRSPANVAAFAKHALERLAIRVEAAESPREAVAGADIICTVTAAREPVLRAEWVAPGAHVNAVGASLPADRELDSALVSAARLFVDRRESALHEAGDFLIPRAEGVIGDDHIRADLGEVLLGAQPGRTSPTEITVFKSLGLAVEDVAAARRIYENARRQGLGSWLDLTGPEH